MYFFSLTFSNDHLAVEIIVRFKSKSFWVLEKNCVLILGTDNWSNKTDFSRRTYM